MGGIERARPVACRSRTTWPPARASATEELHEETERAERERALERRSVVRLRALVAVLTAAVLVAAGLTAVAVNRAGRRSACATKARSSALTSSSLANLESIPTSAPSSPSTRCRLSVERGEPVPSETVEALHWAMQEAGVDLPGRRRSDRRRRRAVGHARASSTSPSPSSRTPRDRKIPRDLNAGECRRYFGPRRCPALPATFPAGHRARTDHAGAAPAGRAASTTAAARGDARHDAVERASRTRKPSRPSGMSSTASPSGRASRSTSSTSPSWRAGSRRSRRKGILPTSPRRSPASVATSARRGHLVDLGDVPGRRTAQGGPESVSRLARHARRRRIVARRARPSLRRVHAAEREGPGLVSAPELQRAGYAIPADVGRADRDSSGRLQGGRQTPWCMGLESGDADGWPATDWIENLVLAEAGPEAYDAWTFHELPFDSPPVRRAFERFGDIVFAGGLGARRTRGRRRDVRSSRPSSRCSTIHPAAGCTCSRRSQRRSCLPEHRDGRPTRSPSRRWRDRSEA